MTPEEKALVLEAARKPSDATISRIRWRHEDCDPSSCVATMEQGCEPTVLLAALSRLLARLDGGEVKEAMAL